MANYSDLTRKEQVLARLKAADGGWVDGPEIANEAVGGSEGLRRLRELADEGHNIRKRHHPDTNRDIWQYRLAPTVLAIPTHEEAAETLASIQQQVAQRPPVEPAEKPVYPKYEPPAPGSPIRRKEDGTYEYVPPQRPLEEAGQLTIPPDPPQPAGAKFDARPRRIDYGSVAICPRCHSKTTRGRPPKNDKPLGRQKKRATDDEGSKLIDHEGVLLFRDPHATKPVPCTRCNGYGIVPNIGPIASSD